ncbi:MAG: hypothetical protein GF315_12510 [candidate division Zixibacteria bacterium]|nr:hypothetical protein [candidate division Zixibacteria bacterium]
MPDDEKKKPDTSEQEGEVEKVKTDKIKHERLAEEERRIAERKEKFREFAKDKMRRDNKGIMRKRKDKFLGGTRGRRGG